MTVEQITHHFLAHRNVTNELINKIEAGHYEYKPAPTSMSAFELSTHILTSFYVFASVVKSGDLSPLGQKADFSGKSLSDLAAEYTQKTVDVLRSLSEDDLNKTIDATAAFGRKLPEVNFYKWPLTMKFIIKEIYTSTYVRWVIQIFLYLFSSVNGYKIVRACKRPS